MAQYSSQARILSEVAVLAPDPIQHQGAEATAMVGNMLLGLSEKLQATKEARLGAEAMAAYQEAESQYELSILNKDPGEDGVDFVNDRKQHMRAAKGRALAGLPRGLRDRLSNQFTIWDQKGEAQVGLYAIKKETQLYNDNMIPTFEMAARAGKPEIAETYIIQGNLSEREESIARSKATKVFDAIELEQQSDMATQMGMFVAEEQGLPEAMDALKRLRESGQISIDAYEDARDRTIRDTRDREILKEDQKRQYELDLINKSSEISMEQYIKELDGSILDRHEQDVLIRSEVFRREAIQKGEPDPLVYRKNNPLYWELLQKSADHTITEKEIRKAVGWDPENRDKTGITINDYLQMTNILKESNGVLSSQAKSNAAIMREMDGLFSDIDTELMIADNPKQVIRTAQIKARNILEGRIQEADAKGTPLRGMDLTKEMLRVQRDVQKELTDEATPESILQTVSGPSRDLLMSSIKTIKNDADYEKLPSGAIFIGPDGKRRRKP